MLLNLPLQSFESEVGLWRKEAGSEGDIHAKGPSEGMMINKKMVTHETKGLTRHLRPHIPQNKIFMDIQVNVATDEYMYAKQRITAGDEQRIVCCCHRKKNHHIFQLNIVS